VWDDATVLDEFLTTSETARQWRERTVQACHLWLRPNRVRGPWAGAQVLRGSESAAPAGGTVAYIARLDLTPRGTVAMWGSAAPGLLHHLPDTDELRLGLPLVDRPYMQPVSFSVWRTEQSAMRFAHGGEGHRDAVRRLQRSQQNVVGRFSSGRFEPYRCEGTWNGREALNLVNQES
jgi:hypothetical protein